MAAKAPRAALMAAARPAAAAASSLGVAAAIFGGAFWTGGGWPPKGTAPEDDEGVLEVRGGDGASGGILENCPKSRAASNGQAPNKENWPAD